MLLRWIALANLLLVATAAWMLARTAGTLAASLIRPRPQAGPSMALPAAEPSAPPDLDPAVLGRLLGLADPSAPAALAEAAPQPPGCDDPGSQAVKSPAGLTLVGAILGEPPGGSFATLLDAGTHERRAVGVGERFGEAEVLGVARVGVADDPTGNGFRVVALVCRRGVREYLELDAGVEPGGAPPSGVPAARPGVTGVRALGEDRYEVDRRVIEGVLADPVMLTAIQLVPVLENGSCKGFRVTSVRPGSVYAAAGVQPGDVIERVNGYQASSADRMFEIYQRLRESTRLVLELRRGGTPLRREFRIVDG